MANNTPHIVGGGLGTFRKEGKAAFEKSEKAAAAAKAKATHIAFINSLKK